MGSAVAVGQPARDVLWRCECPRARTPSQSRLIGTAVPTAHVLSAGMRLSLRRATMQDHRHLSNECSACRIGARSAPLLPTFAERESKFCPDAFSNRPSGAMIA